MLTRVPSGSNGLSGLPRSITGLVIGSMTQARGFDGG